MKDVGTDFSSRYAWPKWLTVSAVLVALDQTLKLWVSNATPLGFNYAVTSFFNIVHARNPGAAFSFLADAGGWQRWFLLVVAIGAAVFLAWLIRRGIASRAETIAYVAILGGALGNAIDRARLGYVVDFLDFHLKGWHWPAFNTADVCITTGAIVLVAMALTQSHDK
jgi:signal peptidase II